MLTDETLLRQLLRTAACAKRKPQKPNPDEEAPQAPKVRGFGHILDELYREDGLSQQVIADRIGIRPQSVSEAILVLEEKGYVTRRPSQTDRRATLVYITDDGKRHREETSAERERRARALFSPLSDEEKEELSALLRKIGENVTSEL